jgi:hypothetical protein
MPHQDFTPSKSRAIRKEPDLGDFAETPQKKFKTKIKDSSTLSASKTTSLSTELEGVQPTDDEKNIEEKFDNTPSSLEYHRKLVRGRRTPEAGENLVNERLSYLQNRREKGTELLSRDRQVQAQREEQRARVSDNLNAITARAGTAPPAQGKIKLPRPGTAAREEFNLHVKNIYKSVSGWSDSSIS